MQGGEGREQSLIVEKVSKSYPLFSRRRDRLGMLLGLAPSCRWKKALDDVSFTGRPGEAIGIVGENGSGKSTLLRVVAGISRPDAGDVYVRSPVAAILELSLGFHPDFSGRENALLYGSLLGIPQDEMRARLDEIMAFAELGEFADQPLRTYSSGMAARLAYAVATQVDPEVLVVDEALAVGDGAFQKRCVDHMRALKNKGKTILFCSHSLYLVSTFCDTALWLREGRVEAQGDAKAVVEAYDEYLARRGAQAQRFAGAEAETPQNVRPQLRALRTEPKPEEWTVGMPLTFILDFVAPKGSSPFHLAVSVDTLDERCVIFTSTYWEGLPPLQVLGEGTVSCTLEQLPLGHGKFWLNGFLFDNTGLVVWDRIRLPRPLEVQGDRWNPSLLRVPYHWKLR